MSSINLIDFIKENIPDCQREVHILEEIEKYKRENNKNPVIFFDLFNILYIFGQSDKREIFCGSRMNVLNKKIAKFFEQLKKVNVEIIFFHKNHTYIAYNPEDRKLKTEANFIFKATQEFYEYQERRRKPIDNFVPAREEAFSIRRLYTTNHFPNFAKYGEIVPIHQYSEIVLLAQQKNALAIVSIYSEFLIYDADWKNWSLYDIDIKSLTTMELKKHGGLKEYFNLNTQQFNLFWMLKKNVVMVLQDHLAHIHYLADYVKQFENPLTDDDYGQIADEILSNCHRAKKQRYFLRDDMNRLMEMEKLEYLQEEVIRPKTIESELAKRDILSYNIYKRYPINLPRLLVDTLFCDAPPFFTYWGMLNDIISKKVGIIFHDCGVRTFQYTTVCRKTQDEHYVVENKIAKFPPVILPDLLDLMDSSNKMYEDCRYQILSWIVFNNEKFSEFLMSQEKKLLIESLTIKYLLRFKQINKTEADLLLLSLDCPADEAEFPRPLFIDLRAANVTFTFIQMYFQLKTFLTVLGLNEFFEFPLEFDGMCFHKNYYRLNDRNFNIEQQFIQKSHLKGYRDIAFF